MPGAIERCMLYGAEARNYHITVTLNLWTERPADGSAEAAHESRRRAMVEHQLRRRGIRDPRVLEAVGQVPRHAFVPPELAESAYDDKPLPIGESGTISQPFIVGLMTQAAGIMPGDRVLEVGAGSGYQAAILSVLGASVIGVERNHAMADAARARLRDLGFENIEIVRGDGSVGYPSRAPYAAILVAAAAPRIPEPLIEQLADGGRIVIPLGDLRAQSLVLGIKAGDEVVTRDLGACQFVPLIGEAAWPETVVARAE